MSENKNLLEVRNLKQHFDVPTGFLKSLKLKAVDDVTFDIKEGETLGLVGESGCGKTTVGRTILHLYKPTAGEVWFDGKLIKSKTVGQKKYVEDIKNSTITIAVGPAGTGKTYLAVALAATAYKSKQIDKIILTRPAVEAGEKLGFLPGDLQEKVNPYLRPLYDGLQEMFGLETYQKLIEKNAIEVAPLAYMRGRTLSNAFIILDEAQNTTQEQMKMFLTRLGENSKMVVTGDLTQTDLPDGKKSGLGQAVTILKNIEGISITHLKERDVVRHPLVQAIVKAYEKSDKSFKGEV